MRIVIQSPGFKADEKLLDFVTSKLQNLAHFNEAIIEGNVCLKMDRSATQENKLCEIKLAVPGNDLFVTKNSETFQESIIKAVNALKSQLSDLKTEHKGGATID
jgi:putative sigma-54 modulation protein